MSFIPAKPLPPSHTYAVWGVVVENTYAGLFSGSLVSRVVAVPFACLSGLSCPVFSVGRFVSGRSFACVSRVGRAVLFGREY